MHIIGPDPAETVVGGELSQRAMLACGTATDGRASRACTSPHVNRRSASVTRNLKKSKGAVRCNAVHCAVPNSEFRRRPPGEARATGRPAASRLEWESIQSQVRSRAAWRCQACGRRSRLDVHHVIKRSRGGSDSTSTAWSPSAAPATTRPTRRWRLAG